MNQPGTLIVGMGSSHGDDAVGWNVADSLANDVDKNDVRVKKAASPIQMLDWMLGVERMILCDACRGLGELGELRRWVWPASELVQVSWSGTHDFSVTASLQLAERLDRLPPHVTIWTVEAAKGNPLDAMSPEAEAAVPRLVGLIARELMRSPNFKGEYW